MIMNPFIPDVVTEAQGLLGPDYLQLRHLTLPHITLMFKFHDFIQENFNA
jgi:hypothetical protein